MPATNIVYFYKKKLPGIIVTMLLGYCRIQYHISLISNAYFTAYFYSIPIGCTPNIVQLIFLASQTFQHGNTVPTRAVCFLKKFLLVMYGYKN